MHLSRPLGQALPLPRRGAAPATSLVAEPQARSEGQGAGQTGSPPSPTARLCIESRTRPASRGVQRRRGPGRRVLSGREESELGWPGGGEGGTQAADGGTRALSGCTLAAPGLGAGPALPRRLSKPVSGLQPWEEGSAGDTGDSGEQGDRQPCPGRSHLGAVKPRRSTEKSRSLARLETRCPWSPHLAPAIKGQGPTRPPLPPDGRVGPAAREGQGRPAGIQRMGTVAPAGC